MKVDLPYIAFPNIKAPPLILNMGSPEFQVLTSAPKTTLKRAKTKVNRGELTGVLSTFL